MAATTDDIMQMLKVMVNTINTMKITIEKSEKKTEAISAELQRLRLKINTIGGK